jgi:hypothetical protein
MNPSSINAHRTADHILTRLTTIEYAIADRRPMADEKFTEPLDGVKGFHRHVDK